MKTFLKKLLPVRVMTKHHNRLLRYYMADFNCSVRARLTATVLL
jgi:hypothetical protein